MFSDDAVSPEIPAVLSVDPDVQKAPDVRLLHRLAEEAWRLGRRLDRAVAEVGPEPLEGVRDALVRLQDLLDEAGVKAVDHDGERYVDGLRLDILHVEGDATAESGSPLCVV